MPLYQDLITELKKNSLTEKQFSALKRELALKYKEKTIPSNIQILLHASEQDLFWLKPKLLTKPVRTISGVSPVALMTAPSKCPHGRCSFCPGGFGSPWGDVPQSYTGHEPATMRGIRNNYDSYLMTFNRLEQYILLGHTVDKVEFIIMGGTFPATAKEYQEEFIHGAFKALNDFSELFFDEEGNLNIEDFKEFFELPGEMQDQQRMKNIQEKVLKLKPVTVITTRSQEREQRRRPGQDGEASRAVSQNQFPGSTAFQGIQPADSEIRSRRWRASPAQAALFAGEHRALRGAAASRLELSNKKADVPRMGQPPCQPADETEEARPKAAALPLCSPTAITINTTKTTLEHEQLRNETAQIRCVALCIETKPDWGLLEHGNEMLRQGCTRVELGIESVYDDVLTFTHRGHTAADSKKSIQILRDLGFKINFHYMPGLPLTDQERDIAGMKQLFSDPDYRPDMIKLYPTMVAPGTALHQQWKQGKFEPISTEEAALRVVEFKKSCPEYCRIQRIQRDVPTKYWAAGVGLTNFRQYIHQNYKFSCRCIRCREPKGRKVNWERVEIMVHQYEASQGQEFFISAEDTENDILIGFCRLRFPHQYLRPEITPGSALIRELHVYGTATAIGEEGVVQHRGWGRKLMEKAEEIARSQGKKKMVVISGVGVREYYYKQGYGKEGVYVVKEL